MTLTVHHLQVSQSERVVWLCEELGIDYELKNYARDPVFAPANYKALHPTEAAPVIDDNGTKIAESAACVEYIAQIHGSGKFIVKPGEKNYAHFVYWFHFANGTLQPSLSRPMFLGMAGADPNSQMAQHGKHRNENTLAMIDDRLKNNKYIAGPELTAADIMMVFTLTTMRQFSPLNLGKYSNLLRWLKDCAARPGYRKAMEKGDPQSVDVESGISAEGPELFPALKKMQEARSKA